MFRDTEDAPLFARLAEAWTIAVTLATALLMKFLVS